MKIIPETHRLSRLIRQITYKYESREDALGRPDPKYMKGRQIMWLIYDYYQIGEINHRIKETEDLLNCHMVGSDLRKYHDE